MREALARSNRDLMLSREVDEAPSRLTLLLRVVLHKPIEVAGCLAMAAFVVAILVNALAMQTGTHPAPFFTRQATVALPSASTPQDAAPPAAAAPASASASTPNTLLRQVQAALLARHLYDGSADGVLGPKTTASIRAFQTQAGLSVDGQPSQDLLDRINAEAAPADNADPIGALLATSSAVPPDRKLLAVEKALAALGYGPLKVDGLMDGATHGAIARFERDRSMPPTGEVSPRLIRELAAMSGTPVE